MPPVLRGREGRSSESGIGQTEGQAIRPAPYCIPNETESAFRYPDGSPESAASCTITHLQEDNSQFV